MSWILLVIAGLLEVVWALTMKQSHGFTRPLPAAITIIAMVASFGLLSVSMRAFPLSTSYTIWTGIGAVGTFAVGIIVLGEAANAQREYSRDDGTPTWEALEEVVGGLESGKAVAFASGMAAAAAVFDQLRAGSGRRSPASHRATPLPPSNGWHLLTSATLIRLDLVKR